MGALEIKIPAGLKSAILAVGADLKCRPAVASGDRVSFFDDLGDMADPDAQDRLDDIVESVDADVVLCDAHPGYHSSRAAEAFSRERGVPLIRIQHHRAHVASVLVEHGIVDKTVVGLAFDGTGYGDDGSIWGGEFFVGSVERGFARRGRFAPLLVPGGDIAVRNPWRIALAALLKSGASRAAVESWMKDRGVPATDLDVFAKSLEAPALSSVSTSLGRWFDAASALLGITLVAEREAQAAIEIERLASQQPSSDAPWRCEIESGELYTIRFPDLAAIAAAHRNEAGAYALAFHERVAEAAVDVASRLASECGSDIVVASGGCFLNRLLDRLIADGLSKRGLRMLRGIDLPPGDAAIALGQIGLVLPQYQL